MRGPQGRSNLLFALRGPGSGLASLRGLGRATQLTVDRFPAASTENPPSGTWVERPGLADGWLRSYSDDSHSGNRPELSAFDAEPALSAVEGLGSSPSPFLAELGDSALLPLLPPLRNPCCEQDVPRAS